MNNVKTYIYESPDKGKTIFRREFGKTERERKTVRVNPVQNLIADPTPQIEIVWIPESECTWGS
jgi:hypothetical protein